MNSLALHRNVPQFGIVFTVDFELRVIPHEASHYRTNCLIVVLTQVLFSVLATICIYLYVQVHRLKNWFSIKKLEV